MISVCIPVYNAERFIAATIESVLRQTLTDFELIIVDDCSSDRSLEVVSRYHDDRIRIVVNDRNLGPEKNWNKAVELARGDYIKVLCHDDLLYPECLEKQVAVLAEPRNVGVTLVSCKRNILNGQGRRLFSRSYPGRTGRRDGREAVRQMVRHGANLIGEPSAVLFRTATARKIGLFSARLPYVVDMDYWCRLLREGDLYHIRETLSAYCISRGAWSFALFTLQRRHFIQLVESLAADPVFGITAFDVLSGRLTSLVQTLLRRLCYLVWGLGHRA